MNSVTLHENSTLRERYYRFTHKSGLDIYVFPKKLSTSYAVFGTKYGSVDNRFRIAGENEYTTVPDGIAHYLEHRMFTQSDGSDITERFSEYGADSNAYTTYTKTVYLFSATEQVEQSLAALLDFVTDPNFTEELVERERGIIIQEIRMGEDNPYNQCFDRLMEALYHNNSIRNNVAGTVESVETITAEMLNRCYRTFYNPRNMALVVCGDITPERVADIADRAIPENFRAVDVERYYATEPRTVKTAVTEREMAVSKPIFTIGVKDPEIVSDGNERIHRYAAMSILCDAVFSRSGELYNTLFEQGKISPDFSYSYSSAETFAFTTISGDADDPMAVLADIKDHLRKLVGTGIAPEDVERSRRVLYSDYVKDFDSTEEIANNMIDFIMDGADLLKYGEQLASVTPEEVNRLLETAFQDEYFAISVIWPQRKEKR